MLSWRSFVRTLGEIKGYILFSAFLFVGSIMVGWMWTGFHEFLDSQISQLGEIAKSLHQSANPIVTLFIFIFFNNAIKAVLVMFSGIVFGIFPLYLLVVNGMVLGYLFFDMHREGLNVFMQFTVGILPHGILELPAIIIAAAFGIRFGVLAIQRMTRSKRGSGMTIKEWSKKTGAAAVWITIILLVAALIESTVTLWIMELYRSSI
ncbi:stage II sporulation protein M [Paenibacillus agilis]|uniref:Stage II sporulation protein M n=1 Tax=Paenibacillus agilis TaxID=3020863 RepID=A0A559IAT3_9BACL|nr:stage II sporulation protein M [Paenibacillus agilis]TVX84789.1 stage II sporulation protein M [Paenibacillus agilis]